VNNLSQDIAFKWLEENKNFREEAKVVSLESMATKHSILTIIPTVVVANFHTSLLSISNNEIFD